MRSQLRSRATSGRSKTRTNRARFRRVRFAVEAGKRFTNKPLVRRRNFGKLLYLDNSFVAPHAQKPAGHGRNKVFLRHLELPQKVSMHPQFCRDKAPFPWQPLSI